MQANNVSIGSIYGYKRFTYGHIVFIYNHTVFRKGHIATYYHRIAAINSHIGSTYGHIVTIYKHIVTMKSHILFAHGHTIPIHDHKIKTVEIAWFTDNAALLKTCVKRWITIMTSERCKHRMGKSTEWANPQRITRLVADNYVAFGLRTVPTVHNK